MLHSVILVPCGAPQQKFTRAGAEDQLRVLVAPAVCVVDQNRKQTKPIFSAMMNPEAHFGYWRLNLDVACHDQ